MASKAELKCVISADSRAFYKEMASIQHGIPHLAKNIVLGVGAGAAALTGVWAGAIHHVMELGDSMTDLSSRTGLSTDTLQLLAYAAKRTGADIGIIEPAMKGLSKALAGTAKPEARKALHALSLSLKDLKSQSPDEQLRRVLTALGNMEPGAKRTAYAVALLGKSGMGAVPLARAFGDLGDTARSLGIVLSPDKIAAADEMAEAWENLKEKILGVGAAAVVPDLERLSEAINSVIVNPALWDAVQAGLSKVSQSITDVAIKLTEQLNDPAAMKDFAANIMSIAEAFGKLASAAGTLTGFIGPIAQFFNESLEGWKIIMGAFDSANVAPQAFRPTEGSDAVVGAIQDMHQTVQQRLPNAAAGGVP